MKIRSKLSGVVWALVAVTLTISSLFLWGGVRFQYHIERSQLAHRHHDVLISLSRRVDRLFTIVYESFIRPREAHAEEICMASQEVRETFCALMPCADAEISFVEPDEIEAQRSQKARLLALRRDWCRNRG